MAMMQRYLSNPDDPDSEADIAMQIMISQAAVDSKGFDILVPEAVDGIKRVIEGCCKQSWRWRLLLRHAMLIICVRCTLFLFSTTRDSVPGSQH